MYAMLLFVVGFIFGTEGS